MTNEPKLLPIDIDYILEKIKGKLNEAETDHEKATSSLDELINLGRKEAFSEVMPLLYALKRAVPISAIHSDGQGNVTDEIWTNEDESAEIERQIVEDARR